MKVAIITVAGISSRFNEEIENENKCLKAIYSEGSVEDTLLYHILNKCIYADQIIIVGGYKFEDLRKYVDYRIEQALRQKIKLIFNKKYRELNSGYSLYLGLQKAFEYSDLEEVLFIEGDLDIDKKSFAKVVCAETSVLTYNYDPIYANKAVIFYKKADGNYRYSFNSSHGLLKIEDDFSALFNSGQCWKFRNVRALKESNMIFGDTDKSGTNLEIVQEYINRIKQNEIMILGLKRWTNCNTREDYKKIKIYWEEEK